MWYLGYISIICTYILLVDVALGWKHSSSSQLQESLSGNNPVLVAFIAPWTEQSKALEPEWLSASKQSNDKLISIDCTSETDVCAKYGVVSYPAIRMFHGDKILSYRGPRKASAILPFLARSKLPAISYLDSTNISTFATLDPAGVFIAHLPPSSSHLHAIFTTLSRHHHTEYSFGVSTSADVAASLGLAIPSFVYYRPSANIQQVFSSNPSLQTLGQFIETATAPTIGEFTRRSELRYMKAGKSIVYLFHKTSVQRSRLLDTLTPLAQKYQEYLNFVTVDVNEYGHMPAAVGLSEGVDVRERLAVFNPMYGQKFPFDQRSAITEANVESFVMDIVQGNIKPWDGSRSGHGEGRTAVHDEI